MRSLVWTAPSVMEVQESPKPALRAGWVLLAVEDSGICGSELGAFLGHNELRRPPLVMGHEFSGTVVELGPEVAQKWAGQLVTVNPFLSCGECRQCRMGQRQLCYSRKIIGIDYPGSYAEFVAVPSTALYKVVDPLMGALVEPLACGVRAAALAGAEVGDSVMVIGAGTIGLMALRVLKAKGAGRRIVLDTNPARLRWATEWGATSILNPKTDDVESAVKDATSGEGVDSVVDAVGSGQTRSQAVASVRRGGKAVFIGLHENVSSLPGNEIVRSEKQIIGSFSYSDEDFRRSVALVNEGFLEASSGWLDIRDLGTGQESFLEQTTVSAPYSKIILRSKQ
ncbi:MAG: galactitol-1-phosphate 5-dehydrogenase [Thaumarchaeota archaeon]|nr:galactitol-1-phosphate 5-dehydrogenase [Nitrososphaerota archaeon]